MPSPAGTDEPQIPTSIYTLIHDLHTTITKSIDTALTWDQLNSPPINYTVVRPIVSRLLPPGSLDEKRSSNAGFLGVPTRGGDDCGEAGGARSSSQPEAGLGKVLFALMANRIQFITLASGDLSYAPLQNSRAAFCELLAIKVLRSYPHPSEEVHLVGELVRGHCAFDGAPEDVWTSMGDDRKDIEETKGSALELAIVSTAKHFLSLPLIQHLTTQIYTGHMVYIPVSSRSLISDSYISERTRQRRRNSNSNNNSDISRPTHTSLTSNGNRNGNGNEIEMEEKDHVFVYNPYEAGWLDHQRLRVPKWRNMMEFVQFGLLLALFIATLSTKNVYHLHPVEVVSGVFTLGFVLDEFAASKEHGWTVYSANAWNAFDMTYIVIFFLYLALRVFGLASDSPATSDLAFDILACGACILFPRLVFFLIRDNVIILALKAMIARFIGFMGLVILAFSGICFCLWTLGRATWTVKQIVWLMLQIWFGSSYLGFAASESFHPIFGPIILISYAALCNVLLITILIAILSNIFADINANAQEEHLFQRVVKTVEGVKSDSVFSYLPPINLFAFIILVPLSWICSPRMLHRINVFAIRLTNFPILVGIAGYERWKFHRGMRGVEMKSGGEVRAGLFDSFLGGGSELLIASVFEAGPPPAAIPSVTPPKASSVAPSVDSEDEEAPTRQLRPFDSPLAKLFGKSQPPSNPKISSKSKISALEKELSDVRASQLRMEEMLSKMIAGGAK